MATWLAVRLSRSSRLKPLVANISRSNILSTLIVAGNEQVRSISSYVILDGPASRKDIRVPYNGLYKSFPYQAWTRSFASDKRELVEAVVPFMGESVSDGTLATFLKKPGDRVEMDEAIAQVETDKVTVDVNSPQAGYIEKFVAKEGDTVVPGTKVAVISMSADGSTPKGEKKKSSPQSSQQLPDSDVKKAKPAPAAPAEEAPKDKVAVPASPPPKTSPLELQLPPKDRERRVPMTRLRKRVATRLKDSQNTFALLTTFNEVDILIRFCFYGAWRLGLGIGHNHLLERSCSNNSLSAVVAQVPFNACYLSSKKGLNDANKNLSKGRKWVINGVNLGHTSSMLCT